MVLLTRPFMASSSLTATATPPARGRKQGGASAQSAIADMSVADVRQGLALMRGAWFRDFSPEQPFTVGRPLPSGMTFDRFAQLFEREHHMKRHNKGRDARPVENEASSPDDSAHH